MFNDFFVGMFNYNRDANGKVLDCFEQESNVPPRAFALMGHILQAHNIWLNRISKPGTDAGNPWQVVDSREYRRMNDTLFDQTIRLIQNGQHDWPQQRIDYITTRGQHFTNTLQDILFHVINHSTYHRAQLAVLFRDAGGIPAVTDYVLYKRGYNNNLL